MKIALIQMPVTADKAENLRTAEAMVMQAAEAGAHIAILPEMFCCPYDNACFPMYGETKDGLICQTLSRLAKAAGLTLVGGSFPEWEGDKLYNACYVFNVQGAVIARHRKAHLFDIQVTGGQSFRESDVFTPGNQVTVFEVEGHTFGVCICFDIRFAELSRCMALRGAEAIFVPAAFNMTTGPMHWELSFRMRAVDNQLFMVGVAPARNESNSYVSYANSMICSPWGQVLACAGTEKRVLVQDIDLAENTSVRSQLPILSARRPSLYGMTE